MAGAGGLFRDSNGHWLGVFQVFLGVCSNLVAELSALKFGLMIAWNKGFRRLICEVDAMVVLLLIKSVDVNFHFLFWLIQDVRLLLNRSWSVLLEHTLQEGNFCADFLA